MTTVNTATITVTAATPTGVPAASQGEATPARMLSRLGSAYGRHPHQQYSTRLTVPRPMTAKRRLSGAAQLELGAGYATIGTGVEKPTIASQLKSSVGGNINLIAGGAGVCGNILGAVGGRRRGTHAAPLLPFRLRTQQAAIGGSINTGGSGAITDRLVTRPASGAGAGRATNLAYYGAAFGRSQRGNAVTTTAAIYSPKSARRGVTATRRTSTAGQGGGSTPGSRRSSQASVRSQSSLGGRASPTHQAQNHRVPTMLIDVQIQLPQSRHWPKWQRDRIAESLFGGPEGRVSEDEQWITLDELDEKMRKLLLLRPQSAAGRKEIENTDPGDRVTGGAEDGENTDTRSSGRRRRGSRRRASLRSRSPSPQLGQQQQQPQQQQAQQQQQQLLLRIKARSPDPETPSPQNPSMEERPRRRPSLSVSADGATPVRRKSSQSGQGIGLGLPHRSSSSKAGSPVAPVMENTNPVSSSTAPVSSSRQDLNSPGSGKQAPISETAPRAQPSQIDDNDQKASSTASPTKSVAAKRFHKVGLGRARAGRLMKTVSEQRFSFLGGNVPGAPGGRRSSTVTAIAANASLGVVLDASTNGNRLCGDDPYTSQLRNRVHNAYYYNNSNSVGNTPRLTGTLIMNPNTSTDTSKVSNTTAANSDGKTTAAITLGHSASTPSIVIETTDDPPGEALAGISNGGVVGRSTLAAATALRSSPRNGRPPVQSLLQVPGFY